MQQQSRAYLLAFIAILFWSTMGTAFKLTLKYLEPASLLFYSSFTACLFLGVFLILTGKWKQLKILKLKHIAFSALLGLFNPFLYYVVLFRAYSLIPAQEAVALNYIWPVMLVIFSMLFLKQKIGWISLFAILLSFFGTFVIATHGQISSFQLSSPLGSGLAVGSSVFWASFFVLNLKDKREAFSKMFLNFCFGFLYILLYNLVNNNVSFPPFRGLAGAVYIGIFEMGLTFALWLTALKLSSNTAKVSNLVYLSPFLSLLMVSIFVGEAILPSTLTGLVLIVAGILIQQVPGRRLKSED